MKLFLIAGEESGDIHASNMIRHLKKMADFSIYGTGGNRLKDLGQVQFFHINDMSIIGLDGIIKKAPFIFNMFKTLKSKLLEVNPDAVILVDYPGFNLRFAKFAKENGYKVIYYIAPQIWAWHFSRIKKIQKYVDLALCILPFEEELYKTNGVNAKFVGNPIINNIKFNFNSKDEFKKKIDLVGDKKVIGIFPGSRKKEIDALIPIINETVEMLGNNYQYLLAKAKNLDQDIFKNYKLSEKIKVIDDYNYDIMKYTDLLWVCSGTATLESAIIGTPLILMYKVSKLTEIIGRIVIKTKFIGLPNIVAGEEVVPELIQDELTPENIIKYTSIIFSKYETYKSRLSQIGKMFNVENPSYQAAKEIYSYLY